MALEDYEDTQSKSMLQGVAVFIMIIMIVMVVLGALWGREPGQFNIQDEAEHRAQIDKETEPLPVGYVFTNTLAHIAEVLLHKQGGYISNDVAPPGVFLDNIPSWEYGALVMLRDATSALRNHFARDQSQSAEDPDLAIAEPHFFFEHTSWALPATEAEYQKGVEALHRYMRRLLHHGGNVKPAQFYSRADNLWQYTEVVIKRLGGISTKLTANTSGSNLGPGLTLEEREKAEKSRTPVPKVSWFEVDNVFFEARGASWALLHILRAIKHDFADILLDKRAMRTVDIMIKSLENSLEPILIPMVLNGDGYGLLANYSLTMANFISRANAAALDLRDIMNRG